LYSKIEKKLPFEMNFKFKKYVEEVQKNTQLSAFDVTEITSDKKPGIRLSFKMNGQLTQLEFIQDNSELKFKTAQGLKNLSEIYYSPEFNAQVDRNYVMPYSELFELAKSRPKEAGQYLATLRKVIMDLEKLEFLQAGVKYSNDQALNIEASKNIWSILLGPDNCWANKSRTDVPFDGQDCIMGGYLTKYSKRLLNGKTVLSCGASGYDGADGANQLKNHLTECRSKGADQLPCNPLVYGSERSGGLICVKKQPPEKVSLACNEKNQIGNEASIKNYLESVAQYYQNEYKEPGKDQKIIKDLNSRIDTGIKYCIEGESGQKKVNQKIQELKSKRDSEQYRIDHDKFDIKMYPLKRGLQKHDRAACETLLNRLVVLKTNQGCLAQTVVALPGAPQPACNNDSVTVVPIPVSAPSPAPAIQINSGTESTNGTKASVNCDNASTDESCKKDWMPWLFGGLFLATLYCMTNNNCSGGSGGGAPVPVPIPPPVPPGPPTTVPVGKPGETTNPRTGHGGVK
jgi:hypothetical protein